jgi:hypothetical protein
MAASLTYWAYLGYMLRPVGPWVASTRAGVCDTSADFGVSE